MDLTKHILNLQGPSHNFPMNSSSVESVSEYEHCQLRAWPEREWAQGIESSRDNEISNLSYTFKTKYETQAERLAVVWRLRYNCSCVSEVSKIVKHGKTGIFPGPSGKVPKKNDRRFTRLIAMFYNLTFKINVMVFVHE